MSRTSFSFDIQQAALPHRLDPDLVEALVIIESDGNPWAINPEPRYRWLVDVRTGEPFRPLTSEEASSAVPPVDFPTLAGDRDQEWTCQRASWGLMQVMGAVARERGFRRPYLTELCNAQINLAYGTKHLAAMVRWAEGEIDAALGAYNAGPGGARGPAGQTYAAKVLRVWRDLRGHR